MNPRFQAFFIPLDEKIVNGKEPRSRITEGRCFVNEPHSFQLVYKNEEEELFPSDPSVEILSPLSPHLQARPVEEVAVTLPFRKGHDDFYALYEPGLVGDLLLEEGAPFSFRYGVYRSILITYDGHGLPGDYEIEAILRYGDGRIAAKASFVLHVSSLSLPPLSLHVSNWMHYDALSTYYGLPMFSKEYKETFRRFLSMGIKHGIDTLLVPLFTPPLDTYVGGERPTAQLVDVKKEGGTYSFSFDRLLSFLREARGMGIRLFEMSHLFTQWGALHAPKVLDVEGHRLFGWETDSLDPEYLSFLSSFLRALTIALEEAGFSREEVYFHLSDEPNANHKDRYERLRSALPPSLRGYKTIDALSEVSLSTLVDLPVVALDRVPDFQKKAEGDIFAYHCCAEEDRHLPNRFLSMPLTRFRALGATLYATGVKGYLHWGYNFYSSGFSKRPIDPYRVNDAEGNFPSGDSFIVYPGVGGKPLSSLRLETLTLALSDYRALTLLESRIGREATLTFLDSFGFGEDFSTYPREEGAFDAFRLALDQKIEETFEPQS